MVLVGHCLGCDYCPYYLVGKGQEIEKREKMEFNQQLLIGAVLGFVVGFLFAKITGKFFKWLFLLIILFVAGYLYIRR